MMYKKERLSMMDQVNVGFVGLGYRAEFALTRFRYIPHARIAALCDSNIHRCTEVNERLSLHGVKEVRCYERYEDLLQDQTIDLIYISTPWDSHARIAIDAMKSGKHVAVEVPAAMTVAECFELVRVSETTGRVCTILENCCYDDFTLATQHMVEAGLFGEIYHCEGAYIHRLCERMVGNNPDYKNAWMPRAYMQMTGNIYPTHGFGPLAMVLGLNRGDRAVSINSVSTRPRVYREYVANTFGEEVDFTLGDVSSSFITTESGKTIELQFDIASPRPYNRKHLVVGTRGMYHKYPTEEITLLPDYHNYLPAEARQQLLHEYRHPIIKEVTPLFGQIDDEVVRAKGVLDFAMDYRLVQNLVQGKAPDLDVYDAALWSSLVELSAQSVALHGAPVEIPDFTSGKWKDPRPAFVVD
ncbi:MAG: Gfo/Idh/MocA family protein [Bacteroidales bacterium]